MEKIDLNGIWGFSFRENARWDDEAAPDHSDLMCVPGTFDTMPAWNSLRGTGYYRREFDLAHDCTGAFLRIDGMGLRGRFELDGREIGRSELAYSAVSFAAGPLAAGRHVLTAALDNTLAEEPDRLFQPYYDFYGFGGFYGDVTLKLMTGAFGLDRVRVRTLDFRTGRVRLIFDFVGNAPGGEYTARIAFDGGAEQAFTAHGNAVACEVPEFKLWSPEAPNLHRVTVRIGDECATAEFGIREIATEGKRLLLNGQDLYLLGVNRHETSGMTGGASPEFLMIADIQNLKRLGGNFIRGSHYPQRERFLKLCDRMGVLVWDETLGWNNTPEQMSNEKFVRLNVEQLQLMIKSSYNHPSVIIYGFLNECSSDTAEGEALVKLLCETAHAEDSGRLVTFACNRRFTDRAHRYTDLIAFNTYPGWIAEHFDQEPTAEMPANQKRIIDTMREKFGHDKPMIVSEMGTCGIYGQHDEANAQWTEEFQAEYLRAVMKTVFSEPELRGLTIWQMNDARSFLRKGQNIRTKPLAQNLAGLFDIYRRPKLAFAAVREGFAARKKKSL